MTQLLIWPLVEELSRRAKRGFCTVCPSFTTFQLHKSHMDTVTCSLFAGVNVLFIQTWPKNWHEKASTFTRRFGFVLSYLQGFPMSDVEFTVTEARKSFRNPPVWLYSRVAHSRVWKGTKETQIRADMESELRLRHRGCPVIQDKHPPRNVRPGENVS